MLTKDTINDKLTKDGRGILMIGEYLGSMNKTEFTCSKKHTWYATPNSVTKKNPSGCPHCSGKFPYTTESVNEKLSSRKIKLIENYVNTHTKSTFECENGHQWKSNTKSVLGGSGCKFCDISKRTLTKEIINQRLSQCDSGHELVGEYLGIMQQSTFKCARGHTRTAQVNAVVNNKTKCPYCTEYYLSKDVVTERLKNNNKNIELVGEYFGTHTKSLFKCEVGHEFMAKPANIMSGKGCPHCAKYGFKNNISAHIYILKFDNFIKYGITNDLERRLLEHRKNGDYELIATKFFKNGSDAKSWEEKIKTTYGGKFVDSARCPDGWTETLSLSYLQKILCSF